MMTAFEMRFRKILNHCAPRTKKEKWKVLIEWESGERSWEPVNSIYAGDKYMLAEVARDHGLLDKWESPRMKIRAAAKNSKMLLRMIKHIRDLVMFNIKYICQILMFTSYTDMQTFSFAM